MAADLTPNPRFRRIRSMGELRPRRRGYTGPFQATHLWNSIIHALKTQVEVKSRRQHLRTYPNCFIGSDAVDVVLCHLMQNMYLSSYDISRTKGIQLCQALMDHKILEPVGSKLFKGETELVFEDSNSHLYRFVASKGGTVYSAEDKSFGKERRQSRSGHVVTICNPSALDSANEKLNQLLHCLCEHPNAHMTSDLTKQAIAPSQKDTENVWKQQVMVRLLQLVDIPVLEDILGSPAKTDYKKHFTDYIVSNTFLDREIMQTLQLPKLDRWLASAVDCLEYFPDEQIVMLSQQFPQSNGENLDLYKKMLFDVIAKYYSQERDPFIEGQMVTVLIGVVELLEQGKRSQALEATQLYLRLLMPQAREELRRFITFMTTASESSAYKLQKQFDNKVIVMKTFTKVIVQNTVVSKAQSEEFSLFLIEQSSELFKTPMELLDLVSTKLRSLQNGLDPDDLSGFTFCQRLTPEEYERERFSNTISEIQQLKAAVDRNSAIPDKKKKKMMKEFLKCHPSAFNGPVLN
ncbi:PREDICTED: DEP domain-containing protein 4 [Nanorana parkeri]|uniref:DEP domain-containing protein 4 n=1 Tax=Nanorana parkeri TaxID=125878 RepID=UPI0008547375|nr:PREDICTED: DEP domain-containing protein 4 [Nanorana parkeri]